MKKILSLLMMLGIVLGVSGMVMGADQQATFTPEGVVSFTVSPLLAFPSAIPGETSVAYSTVTLGETNTEDLTVDIYLKEDADTIFTNVVLTTTDTSLSGLELGGNLNFGSAKITVGVDDTDAESVQSLQNKIITATLTVPAGILPTEKTGIIIYEVTAPAPIAPTA